MSTQDTAARRREWRAGGRLLGAALGGVVGIVRDTHRAVADRVASFLPEAAAPVLAVERGASSAVYLVVGASHRHLPAALASLVALGERSDLAPFSHAPTGRVLLEILNGLWGDRLDAGHETLAIPMAVRVDDRDVPADRAALTAAYPDATPHLVVLVHGLTEGDRAWSRSQGCSGSDGHLDRLRRDLGVTPVLVRYNSGLRVSDNGTRLADLLGELVAAWPVPVETISLVGHSMGGLVARSACRSGELRGSPWTTAVHAVVTLGTPHLGAPLEKSVHALDWALRRTPESEPLGRALSARSTGIQDLRHGALVEADWADADPDALLRDSCTDVPPLPHARYHWVAASITRPADHPVGLLVGDGLVRARSARGTGATRRSPLPLGDGLVVPGAHHLDLLTHPAVHAQLARWVDPRTRRSGALPAPHHAG